MGEVYRAWDPRLEREVAVKMLRIDEDAAPERRRQLVREARTAASLSHPNICTVFEAGESDGRAFIAMELVDGRTLADSIRERPLDPAAAVSTAIQCAAALAHAHARGVLHRDFKAANIILTRRWNREGARLRAGTAPRRSRCGSPEPGASVPRTSVRGTLGDMAPELLRGELAGVGTDIWALGVTLSEMLTGELPFRGHADLELASAILSGTARELPPHIDPRLRAIVRRCLAPDPSLRFGSAADVHQALIRHQRQAGYRWAEPIARLHQVRARWRAAWSPFTILTAIVVLVLAALAWHELRRTPRAAGDAGRIPLIARAHLAVLPTHLIGTATAEPHLGIVIPHDHHPARGVERRSCPADCRCDRVLPPGRFRRQSATPCVESTTSSPARCGARRACNRLKPGAGRHPRQHPRLGGRSFYPQLIEDLPRLEAVVATRVVAALRLPLEWPRR